MYHHYTVKELPESEKPDEKCLRSGPEYLSDAELLAVIIRTWNSREKIYRSSTGDLKLQRKESFESLSYESERINRDSGDWYSQGCTVKVPCRDHKTHDKSNKSSQYLTKQCPLCCKLLYGRTQA